MLSILSFEVSSTTVLVVALLSIGFLTGLVIYLKSWLSGNVDKLRHKYARAASDQPLHKNRNKFAEADIFNWRSTFLNLGWVVALLFAVVAFAWTQYDKTFDISGLLETLEEEIEIEAPRTAERLPPPLPPPPAIQALPDETVIDEQPDFLSQDISEATPVEAPPVQVTAPPVEPPPAIVQIDDEDDIFRVVEEMPRFPGCEDEKTTEDKKKCADKKMLEFIYKNIKYPAIARENGVEGTVVVTFVVEKDGAVTDIKVLREIGAQCGQEAARVVNLMNLEGIKWLPGKQRSRPVRVQFNLPVRFSLE